MIEKISSQIEFSINNTNNSNTIKPKLNIFYLSSDIPSLKYINNKITKAKKFNVDVTLHQPKNKTELTNKLLIIPREEKVIIQYPIDSKTFGDIKELYQLYINKNQDVDGFLFDLLDITYCNTIEDFLNHKSFSPTAKGVLQILNSLNVNLEGKNVTVLGKGLTSGLPIGNAISKLGANLNWLDKNCALEDFKNIIENSEIIISCTGVKNLINKDIHSLKEKAIYINVGMSSDENNKIIGDINYEEISRLENTFYVNNVLNSTGLLTTLNLIFNCI